MKKLLFSTFHFFLVAMAPGRAGRRCKRWARDRGKPRSARSRRGTASIVELRMGSGNFCYHFWKRNNCSCKIQNFCSHTLKHLSLSPDCLYLHVCSWEHFIGIGNWLNGIDKEAEKRCDQSSLDQLFVPWGKVLKATSFRKCQTSLGPRVLHASNEQDCRAPGHERNWDDVVEEYEETGGAKTKYSALGPDRENCQS